MTEMTPRKLNTFLWYSEKDTNVVRELRDKLKNELYLDIWDRENLVPGDDTQLEIKKAVINADAILLFLSSWSVDELGFIQKEFRYVLELVGDKSRKENKLREEIHIIPILLEKDFEIPIEVRMEKRTSLEYYSDDSKYAAYDKLLQSFQKKIKQLVEKGENRTEIRFSAYSDANTQLSKDNKLVTIIRKEEIHKRTVPQAEYPEEFLSYGWATCKSPGILIYAADVSRSMGDSLLGKKKIDFIPDLMLMTLSDIVRYSSEDGKILPTYRVGMFTYAEGVRNVYAAEGEPLGNGLKQLDKFPGPPSNLDVLEESTDTAKVFADILALLKGVLPNLQQSPPPIVVHITDGEYTGNDPEPIALKIMSTGTDQGKTLLLNILLTKDILAKELADLHEWKGVKKSSDVGPKYAKKLFRMTSYMPDVYVRRFKEMGYSIDEKKVKLLFPVEAIEMASKIYSLPNIRIGR